MRYTKAQCNLILKVSLLKLKIIDTLVAGKIMRIDFNHLKANALNFKYNLNHAKAFASKIFNKYIDNRTSYWETIYHAKLCSPFTSRFMLCISILYYICLRNMQRERNILN